jgi:o-succinylbenzoate---CoA ligase
MIVQIAGRQLIPDQPPNEWDLPDYGNLALRFCNQWTSGQQTFTLKTSGSTGKPKEILIQREQMEASARQTIRYLGLTEKDVALVALGTNYIAGQMMLVRALLANMDCRVVEPAKNPMHNLPEYPPVTFTALVPLQLQAIIEANVPDQINRLNEMKAILIGGAPMSAWLIRACQKLRVPVYATYGMTETVSHIALRPINGPAASEYFTVLQGVEVKQDARECLQIRGAVTRNEWITTSDIVRFHGQRTFQWLGRADYVINSGGIKIFPEQLEGFITEQLSNFSNRQHSLMITALPHPDYGEQVILLFEGFKPDAELIREIFSRVESNWNRYWVPKQIRELPEFTRTANGKLLRKHTTELLNR